MGRRRRARKPLPPVWECSDELWALIEPILAEYDPPKQGPPRIDQRGAFDAIIFRLRTGCQWNRLPWEYPDDSSVHRTFQRWVALGIFERLWAVVQEQCEDLGGCDWEWQAADGWLGKARMGGESVGPNPTDRAKPGVKRSPSPSLGPTSRTPSCSVDPLTPSCWHGLSPSRTSPSISASTRGTTTTPAGKPPSTTTTSRTSP
jgi:transposase